MEGNEKNDAKVNLKAEVIIDGDDIIFPKGDMEFYHWMENFLEVATQHCEELGLSQNDLDNIEQKAIDFYMSIRNEKIAQEAYNKSLTRLEKSRRAYEEALKREQSKLQNPE